MIRPKRRWFDFRFLALLIIATGILSAESASGGQAEPRVVCYYTNWSVYRPGQAKFSPQNINPYLCTHLIYAFGGFTTDNALKPFDKYQDIDQGGYAKFTGLKTYNKNLKTLLAIGGWNEASSRFSPLVANSERRHQFVKNIIKFLRQNHFDGLDLDWEYPAYREGGKPRDKNNYAQFVQELRDEFERESKKTGRQRLLLTMAVPAGTEYVEKGYDIPKLNKYLDWFNLLTYDFHSALEPATNHHAPLYPIEEANEYSYDTDLNIDYAIKFYLSHGADASKLVLGIPTYGRSYTLFNPDATELGAPTDGPGEQGDATREKGYLAYYEICQSIKDDPDWTVVHDNPNAMGPYAFKGDQWVGYDDEDMAKKKALYVVNQGLGGIMFWSIDNDDFRGLCTGKPYPIIEAAKSALYGGLGINENEIRKQSLPKSSTRTKANSKIRFSTKDSTVLAQEQNDVLKTVSPKSNRKRPTTTTPIYDTTEPEVEVLFVAVAARSTTPVPPTTPDINQGSNGFKCEDEGFFPHPNDCKKYYWCLDSGPSELGIVAHLFTCPGGLVFNKATDSCDYTRNVLCSKKKQSSTTLPPYTQSTTPKSSPTTLKSVIFKTTSSNFIRNDEYDNDYSNFDDDTSIDGHSLDAEDPKVIKELVKLIKKAGGISELERQLQFNRNGSASFQNSEIHQISSTPSSISKSLYDRILTKKPYNAPPRQQFITTTFAPEIQNTPTKKSFKQEKNVYSNSRGGPQNEGIDKLPEFEGLRRDKPRYITLSRNQVNGLKDEIQESQPVSPELPDLATEQQTSSKLESKVKFNKQPSEPESLSFTVERTPQYKSIPIETSTNAFTASSPRGFSARFPILSQTARPTNNLPGIDAKLLFEEDSIEGTTTTTTVGPTTTTSTTTRASPTYRRKTSVPITLEYYEATNTKTPPKTPITQETTQGPIITTTFPQQQTLEEVIPGQSDSGINLSIQSLDQLKQVFEEEEVSTIPNLEEIPTTSVPIIKPKNNLYSFKKVTNKLDSRYSNEVDNYSGSSEKSDSEFVTTRVKPTYFKTSSTSRPADSNNEASENNIQTIEISKDQTFRGRGSNRFRTSAENANGENYSNEVSTKTPVSRTFRPRSTARSEYAYENDITPAPIQRTGRPDIGQDLSSLTAADFSRSQGPKGRGRSRPNRPVQRILTTTEAEEQTTRSSSRAQTPSRSNRRPTTQNIISETDRDEFVQFNIKQPRKFESRINAKDVGNSNTDSTIYNVNVKTVNSLQDEEKTSKTTQPPIRITLESALNFGYANRKQLRNQVIELERNHEVLQPARSGNVIQDSKIVRPFVGEPNNVRLGFNINGGTAENLDNGLALNVNDLTVETESSTLTPANLITESSQSTANTDLRQTESLTSEITNEEVTIVPSRRTSAILLTENLNQETSPIDTSTIPSRRTSSILLTENLNQETSPIDTSTIPSRRTSSILLTENLNHETSPIDTSTIPSRRTSSTLLTNTLSSFIISDNDDEFQGITISPYEIDSENQGGLSGERRTTSILLNSSPNGQKGSEEIFLKDDAIIPGLRRTTILSQNTEESATIPIEPELNSESLTTGSRRTTILSSNTEPISVSETTTLQSILSPSTTIASRGRTRVNVRRRPATSSSSQAEESSTISSSSRFNLNGSRKRITTTSDSNVEESSSTQTNTINRTRSKYNPPSFRRTTEAISSSPDIEENKTEAPEFTPRKRTRIYPTRKTTTQAPTTVPRNGLPNLDEAIPVTPATPTVTSRSRFVFNVPRNRQTTSNSEDEVTESSIQQGQENQSQTRPRNRFNSFRTRITTKNSVPEDESFTESNQQEEEIVTRVRPKNRFNSFRSRFTTENSLPQEEQFTESNDQEQDEIKPQTRPRNRFNSFRTRTSTSKNTLPEEEPATDSNIEQEEVVSGIRPRNRFNSFRSRITTKNSLPEEESFTESNIQQEDEIVTQTRPRNRFKSFISRTSTTRDTPTEDETQFQQDENLDDTQSPVTRPVKRIKVFRTRKPKTQVDQIDQVKEELDVSNQIRSNGLTTISPELTTIQNEEDEEESTKPATRLNIFNRKITTTSSSLAEVQEDEFTTETDAVISTKTNKYAPVKNRFTTSSLPKEETLLNSNPVDDEIADNQEQEQVKPTRPRFSLAKNRFTTTTTDNILSRINNRFEQAEQIDSSEAPRFGNGRRAQFKPSNKQASDISTESTSETSEGTSLRPIPTRASAADRLKALRNRFVTPTSSQEQNSSTLSNNNNNEEETTQGRQQTNRFRSYQGRTRTSSAVTTEVTQSVENDEPSSSPQPRRRVVKRPRFRTTEASDVNQESTSEGNVPASVTTSSFRSSRKRRPFGQSTDSTTSLGQTEQTETENSDVITPRDRKIYQSNRSRFNNESTNTTESTRDRSAYRRKLVRKRPVSDSTSTTDETSLTSSTLEESTPTISSEDKVNQRQKFRKVVKKLRARPGQTTSTTLATSAVNEQEITDDSTTEYTIEDGGRTKAFIPVSLPDGRTHLLKLNTDGDEEIQNTTEEYKQEDEESVIPSSRTPIRQGKAQNLVKTFENSQRNGIQSQTEEPVQSEESIATPASSEVTRSRFTIRPRGQYSPRRPIASSPGSAPTTESIVRASPSPRNRYSSRVNSGRNSFRAQNFPTETDNEIQVSIRPLSFTPTRNRVVGSRFRNTYKGVPGEQNEVRTVLKPAGRASNNPYANQINEEEEHEEIEFEVVTDKNEVHDFDDQQYVDDNYEAVTEPTVEQSDDVNQEKTTTTKKVVNDPASALKKQNRPTYVPISRKVNAPSNATGNSRQSNVPFNPKLSSAAAGDKQTTRINVPSGGSTEETDDNSPSKISLTTSLINDSNVTSTQLPGTDTQNTITTTPTTTPTNTTDTNEPSDINDNDINNLQEYYANGGNGIPTQAPLINLLLNKTFKKQATTTSKPTTLHHVFAIDFDEEARKSMEEERIRNETELSAEEISKKVEKLIEVNRIVEIYSKKEKNSTADGAAGDTASEELVVEKIPFLDKVGEISRIKLIKLRKETENDTERTAKSLKFVVPEMIFGVETSTISLEGLFDNGKERKGKELVVKTEKDEHNNTINVVYAKSITEQEFQDYTSTTPINGETTETTTAIPRTTRFSDNVVRPLVPMLRPETNESSPLVISIANLDQVILTKGSGSNPPKLGLETASEQSADEVETTTTFVNEKITTIDDKLPEETQNTTASNS